MIVSLYQTHYNIVGGKYVTKAYCFGEPNMSRIGAIRIPTSDTGNGSTQSELRQSGDESSPSERPSVHDGTGESSECDPTGRREPTGGHPSSNLAPLRGTSGDHGNPTLDEGVHLRSGREPEGELHVDIWSGSIPSRLSSISEQLAQNQASLTKKKESLCTYIMRSSKSRLKLARAEELKYILDVLHIEIAIATVRNRPDLIENLLSRRIEFIDLFQAISKLEAEDYQLRFDLKS